MILMDPNIVRTWLKMNESGTLIEQGCERVKPNT